MDFISLYDNLNDLEKIAPFISFLPGEDPEILMQKNYVGIGCMTDGQAVGCILARVNKKEEIAEITSFFVERDFRGQGNGEALLSKLLQHPKMRDVNFLSVKLSIPEDRAGYLWFMRHHFYYVFDECKRYEFSGKELKRFMKHQSIPGESTLSKALSTNRVSEENLRRIKDLSQKELKLLETGPAQKYIKAYKNALSECDSKLSLVYMQGKAPVTVVLISKSEQGSYDIDYIDFAQEKLLECIYTVYCALEELERKIGPEQTVSFIAATDFSEKLFRKHIEYAPKDLTYKESSVVSMTREIGKIYE